MRNYKITIAYDGTKYFGWQRQQNEELTIQGTIERAISSYIGEPVEIHGSGRTDGGVHAFHQIANAKIDKKLDVEVFRDGINALLPDDIRILKIELVKNSFHSRYSAKAKIYEYTIDQREKPGVFTRKYCYHFPTALDVEKMKQAVDYLVGTHDFGGFTDKKDEKSTIRTIYRIEINEEDKKMHFRFYGDGFLYHMVRILTGTLLEVGVRKKTPEDILTILETKDRAKAGVLVPGQGLCLKEVFYEEPGGRV